MRSWISGAEDTSACCAIQISEPFVEIFNFNLTVDDEGRKLTRLRIYWGEREYETGLVVV